LLYSRRFSL